MDHLLCGHSKFKDNGVKYLPTQNPHTIVLTCSDSRVIPEYIFGQGIGDMFTCRVAGNVVDDIVFESIIYAVDNFDIKQIIVMGHEKCGAVRAALDNFDTTNSELVNNIKEGIERTDEYTQAIKKNILSQSNALQVHFDKVPVYAYYYQLNGGLELLHKYI